MTYQLLMNMGLASVKSVLTPIIANISQSSGIAGVDTMFKVSIS